MSLRVKVPSPKAWSVYVLRCGDGTLYTGATNDLQARLLRHRAGKGAAYTRGRLPLRLVFQLPAASRGDALRKEHALKQLPRAAKLALLRTARLSGGQSPSVGLRSSRPSTARRSSG